MRAALLSAPTTSPLGRQQQALKARQQRSGRSSCLVRAHKVELQMQDGTSHILEVSSDESILSVALDKGVLPPYDCQMGVCLRCAAKLEEGQVDQEAGMLSMDVQEKGYALLCVSLPQSDCKIRIIPEYELMDEAMATSAVNQARAG